MTVRDRFDTPVWCGHMSLSMPRLPTGRPTAGHGKLCPSSGQVNSSGPGLVCWALRHPTKMSTIPIITDNCLICFSSVDFRYFRTSDAKNSAISLMSTRRPSLLPARL